MGEALLVDTLVQVEGLFEVIILIALAVGHGRWGRRREGL